MWSKRAAALASLALFVALSGCGPSKDARGPKSAKSGERPVQISRRLEATDLLPADLDVVLRVDVARLKAGLGPGVVESLAQRAQGEGEAFVAEAMTKSDALWIGMRLADLDAGDRVLIAEGRLNEIHLEPSEWKETTPAATMEGVQILDRQGIVPRAGTGRIVAYSGKLYAFISPVEVDATSRLLKNGPDPERGDPTADGLVSVDVRGHRLPASLEKKFPSIAAVIAGIGRVRGSATMSDDGVKVTVDVTAKSAPAAQKVEGFLSTLRDNAAQTRFAPLMKTVVIERVDAHVHLGATVPAPMVVAALSD